MRVVILVCCCVRRVSDFCFSLYHDVRPPFLFLFVLRYHFRHEKTYTAFLSKFVGNARVCDIRDIRPPDIRDV